MGADGRVPDALRGFLSAALFGFSRGGYIHEHVVLGIRLPTALASLVVTMAVCVALSWQHFRRDAYAAFEETFFGALLGIAVTRAGAGWRRAAGRATLGMREAREQEDRDG